MILDTCALLWLAAGSNDLTRNTLKKIEETNVIYVSAIVGFEIAIKAAKGKLKLSFREICPWNFNFAFPRSI
jgi:PIN domain nuclease of toxin-antitoxin system